MNLKYILLNKRSASKKATPSVVPITWHPGKTTLWWHWTDQCPEICRGRRDEAQRLLRAIRLLTASPVALHRGPQQATVPQPPPLQKETWRVWSLHLPTLTLLIKTITFRISGVTILSGTRVRYRNWQFLCPHQHQEGLLSQYLRHTVPYSKGLVKSPPSLENEFYPLSSLPLCPMVLLPAHCPFPSPLPFSCFYSCSSSYPIISTTFLYENVQDKYPRWRILHSTEIERLESKAM